MLRKSGTLLLTFLLVPFALRADTLAIIHVNDTHHHLFPYKSWNGIASAAYKIRELKAMYPNHLFFHAGDIFVGDFSFPYGLGREELKLLSLLSPDAIVIGNHELDITPDSLYSVLSDVGGFTTFLSANLRPDTIPLASIVVPYTTFNKSGKLICVLGLTTNQFNLLNPAQQPVQFENPVYVAQMYVDSAIASQTRSYNLIVSGHTHTCYEEPAKIVNVSGDTTYFAEACQHYEAVGLWLIDMATLRPVSYTLFRLDATSPVDSEFVDSLNALRGRIEAVYGPVFSDFVAYAPRELRNEPDSLYYLDTPLGNLIADALREKAGADVGVLPYFYMAEPLAAGRITSNDVLMAFPYGLSETAITGTNMYLLKVTLRGADLYTLLSITQDFVDSIPIAQVSGMTYRFDPSASPPLEPSDITVGGMPLDTNASYSIAMDMGTLYLANLLGITPVAVETTAYTMFTAMREYFSELGMVDHTSEGRIMYKGITAVKENREGVRYTLRINGREIVSDYPITVFDVSGRMLAYNMRRFAAPSSGVFFVKTGRSVRKVILR